MTHDARTPERTSKDYAIEFGEYLARAADRYLAVVDAWEEGYAEGDARRSLESAIYEFRKRAARAK
jgi:hypothetical protein